MTATIVCIDDEQPICSILRAILQKMGPVETFTDPELALQFIRTADVALVICDYRMPALTGLDVLARLEGSIPFVMMSGDQAVYPLVEGDRRVAAFLAKPFVPSDVVALVRRLLPGR